ncbi:MAG: hypothetical protein R3B47_09245 [Bacteroidia bacterium]
MLYMVNSSIGNSQGRVYSKFHPVALLLTGWLFFIFHFSHMTHILRQFSISLLLFCLAMAAGQSLFATHFVGGEITYRHISGDTYEVTMKYYRDCDGISFGSSERVDISPSAADHPLLRFHA